jgi:hypothetical protein
MVTGTDTTIVRADDPPRRTFSSRLVNGRSAMTKTAAELIPIADPGVSTDGEPAELAGAWTGAVLADIGPGN